jgi:hypothetical protein
VTNIFYKVLQCLHLDKSQPHDQERTVEIV